jgi:tetratricopeptide (TPR) repeat protein
MKAILTFSLGLFLALVFFVVPTQAQQRVVFHRVIVNVILPNTISYPQVIEVKLDSERTGSPLSTRSLIRETRTEFSQVGNGEYIVTVTADNEKVLENYTERFSLRGAFSLIKQINVLMRPKIKMAGETVAPGTLAVPGTAKAGKPEVPKDAIKAFEKGINKSSQGKSEDAIKAFQEAIKYHPTYLDAINNLAVEYIKLARFDEAATQLESALKIDNNSSLSHLNMGIILNEKKKYNDARDHLAKAVELDFNNPLSHYELGIASFQLNDFTQAQIEFETTAKMAAQKIPLSRLYLAELYKRNAQVTEAIQQLEAFLKENKDKDNPYAQVVKDELAKLKQIKQ